MSPEMPGRAEPREPGNPGGAGAAGPRAAGPSAAGPSAAAPTAGPTFKPGAERVNQNDDLPYAQDDRPRRPRPNPNPTPTPEPAAPRYAKPSRGGGRKVRARKVRRIVRHIDPWSVLKISLLFFLAIFLIICVASAVLWSAGRASGTVDDVESFITSVGGFGNCEPIDGAESTTSTTQPAVTTTAPVDQLDPTGDATTVPAGPVQPVDPSDDEDCPAGQRLVGEFRFEDGRIFQAFALGGVVLVLAGAAMAVVLTLLFNLISDLMGGVRVTVLEEEPPPRLRSGSPAPRRGD